MTMPRLQGSSLIERMLAVAVLGICTAIAVPLYWQHANRSQVSRALETVAGPCAAVSAYYAAHGRMPVAASLAVDAPSPLVAHIAGVPDDAASRFLITLSASNALASELRRTTFELTGSGIPGGVRWTCRPGGPSPTPARYLPEDCNP